MGYHGSCGIKVRATLVVTKYSTVTTVLFVPYLP